MHAYSSPQYFGWTGIFRKAEQISVLAMKEPLPSFIKGEIKWKMKLLLFNLV